MLEHTTIEGTFDFNKTPLAPPGINVLVHKNRNSVKLGESMDDRDSTLGLKCITACNVPDIHQTKGGKEIHMW